MHTNVLLIGLNLELYGTTQTILTNPQQILLEFLQKPTPITNKYKQTQILKISAKERNTNTHTHTHTTVPYPTTPYCSECLLLNT